MNMNEVEVKGLVEEFLSSQDLKGYRYEFLKVSFDDKYPDEYGAIFNVYSPENSMIDGPVVFIIDKNSKEVSFL